MRKTLKIKKVFTDKDYDNENGLLTQVWGAGQWHFLHSISFNYPINPTQQQKKQYRDYILSLVYILPCKFCRINLKKNFKKLPITMAQMKNRETFSNYIYNLHELVNNMLNKKSGLTYKDVRERYEHFRARCILPHSSMIFLKKQKNTLKKHKTESGCTEPLYGEKMKCILKFVPETKKCNTFQVDKRCIKRR